MAKNFRSRLGIRSLMSRRLSSKAMPRFCSSNTRPNSLPIGRPISVATMLKPKPRLCPARSERASISRASGSWAAKAFSRRLRRNSSHTSGSEPNARPAKRNQRRVDPHHGPQADSHHRQHRRYHRELANGQIGVGLFEQQADVAEPLDERVDEARLVVQRLGQDAAFFGRGVFRGGWASRRRSAGRGGRRSYSPACCAAARPPRPPARRLPRTPVRAISAGLTA